ncbi:CvpA family protein [Schlegelella sp. S2-27]|uniref:CvpA family protein n=1 Tax=Caldimonas mangrovi TaxID=2944811 RepID=A0ABT0YU68_9BURK|nr:CvpA family protein [Caldimonas mangrovi]MCM5681812.1 CvpA family protein [Caldimonas mangrovi]
MSLEDYNLVDAGLVLVAMLGLWSGWRRGFVVSASGLLVLVLGVAAAFWGYRYPASWLEAAVPSLGVWTQPVAFVLSYVLAWALFGTLAHQVVRATPNAAHLHGANRAAGLVPGLANGLINAAIVAVLLLSVPLFDGLSAQARDSVVAQRLAAPAEWAESKLAVIFDDAVQRTLTRLTVRPGSTERIQLPFQVQAPRARPDLEARMLEMLNKERAEAGLPPLKPDAELTGVARAHARDMFARGFFSHVTPEGRDPFDRMRAGGVRFLIAGENLALARTLPMAHQGLMNSPGHRANILRPAFGRVGIGVLDGGMHGLMVTQKFRN